MNQRAASRAAWSVWGLTVVLVLLLPIVARAGHTGDTWHDLLLEGVAILGFATIGVLTWSRQPANPIGWILSWIGFAAAVGNVAGAYANWGIDQGADVPFATTAAWLGRVTLPLVLVAIPLIFLLFPTGAVPSRRWRPVLWVLIGAIAVNVLLIAVTPGSVTSGFTELDHRTPNPLGLPPSWHTAVVGISITAGMVVLACAILSLISLVLRYRRSVGEERQQIRWLAFVGGLALAIGLIGLLIGIVRQIAGIHVGDEDPVGTTVFIAILFLAIFGVPAACGIAILRYHLWDLDVVVRKTVLYAVLVGLFLGLVGLVALIGLGHVAFANLNRYVLVALGLGLGLLFVPLRRLAGRIADRLVYGGRATPYEVLTAFSERAGETYATDDVLPRMAVVLAQGVGARSARVWLRVGNELRVAAAWPAAGDPRAPVAIDGDALPDLAPERAVEVREAGDVLGALSVELPANDPMTPAKERLILDLAGQAGLLLRNVRLIEELRASRQRLVSAQDQERRRIERNIHDGAQQQLVALQVKLGLARRMTDGVSGPVSAALDQLQGDAQQALEDLRDLARGIYPPLLADQGLVAALQAQARKAAVPTTVEATDVTRYAAEIESTVYFCALEALNNVAKYANASHAEVTVAQTNGDLSFTVADDGTGFDPAATSFGTGLRGMADRLDAVGGRLLVESRPGVGTTIAGNLPIGDHP